MVYNTKQSGTYASTFQTNLLPLPYPRHFSDQVHVDNYRLRELLSLTAKDNNANMWLTRTYFLAALTRPVQSQPNSVSKYTTTYPFRGWSEASPVMDGARTEQNNRAEHRE